MAERITEIVQWGVRKQTPHPYAYPWNEWQDGSVWKIARGVDYSAKSTSMVSMLQRAAREHGLKVRLMVDWNPQDPQYHDSITFQFYAR